MTKCVYIFSKDGVDGDVSFTEDDRGLVVTVTPRFAAKDDRPTLAFFQTILSDGTVLRREVDKLFGSTGRRRNLDRTLNVKPKFDSGDADAEDVDAEDADVEDSDEIEAEPTEGRKKNK